MLFGGEPGGGIALTDGGWLLAILPPGAFFSLALAVAIKNLIDMRRQQTINDGMRTLRARPGSGTR